MSWNWPRAARILARARAGRHVPLEALAFERRPLDPGEKLIAPPAVCVPGAMERVRALSPWRDDATERLLVEGGELEHAPSAELHFADVELVGGYLYAGPAVAAVGHGQESWWLPKAPSERIQSARLRSNFASAGWFANLVLDEFPRALGARPGFEEIRALGRPFAHQMGYQELLGIAPARTVPRACIEHLILCQDFAQNRAKERAYRELRARLRRALARERAPAGKDSGGPDSPRSARPVFLDRGAGGEPRPIANREALVAFLADRGVDWIDPQSLSARELARRTLESPLILGVEGSQLSHAVYSAADRASFLVLQPPDRFAMTFKEFTDRVGMGFGFVVGRPAPGGMEIPLDELAFVLECLLP